LAPFIGPRGFLEGSDDQIDRIDVEDALFDEHCLDRGDPRLDRCQVSRW
jgi:hypothetical protein